MTAAPASPYKGLNAFEDSELDALLFFGREREREIVVANLIASRLTVLYGPSGVGKSSLLAAAVARSLRELPEEPIVLVFSRWNDDPAESLAALAAEAAGVGRNGSALETLERAQQGRDIYLVLDQTEEYFLYHADDAGPGSFAETLPALLSAPYRVNVLVSLREDALAKLDRFTGRIPGLFANTLRLDRLDRQAATAAIVRPLERYSELTGHAVAIEPELVERVLEEVGAGRIEPALGGLGAVEGADDTRIEAPYLQLVLQRLWDEERAAGSDVLQAATLERLGGAGHIVEEHLAGAMTALSSDERDLAARLFNHLVTPSGTKIAHDVSDLAGLGRVPVEELLPLLATLTERRILRSVEEGPSVRYEIFHDVLAQPVLAWRSEHEAARELERQREAADRRHRRLLGVIGVGAVLLTVMGAVTVYALTQRAAARDQAREARANGLVAHADAQLERDPELSLVLALEAAEVDPSEHSERALRDALLASRVRAVVEVGEPLLAVAASGNRLLTVSAEGEVVAADPTTGEIGRRTPTGVPALDASFADDGSAVVTGRDGAVRLVRPDGAVARVPDVTGAEGAAISRDGTLTAVVRAGGVTLVDTASGAVRRAYDHPGAISAAVSPLDRRLATGGRDRLVRIWSAQSGRRIHVLTEHSGHAVDVEFNHDGTIVASASTDGLARMWRSSDWSLSGVLAGHLHALTGVAFSSDDEHVVTTGKDGTARVFHAETGSPLFTLAGHADWVTAADFTGRAGSQIVTASADGTARVWDAVFQPVAGELASLRAPVAWATLDQDGRLRVLTEAGRTHVLDPATGKRLSVEGGGRKPRRAVAPDGTVAVVRGRTVVLRRGGDEQVLALHRDRVTSVAFSPDGSLLATASIDHDVRLWETATGEHVRVLQHNTAVHDAQFSPDGRWLVSAAFRGALWDVREGVNVIRLQGHDGTFTSATFDETGRRLLTGGVDGTVRSYDCEVCGSLDELEALARERLEATGRTLSEAERARYLG